MAIDPNSSASQVSAAQIRGTGPAPSVANAVKLTVQSANRALGSSGSGPWDYHTGPDGRAVAIPPGGDYHTGNDGRAIAIPKGWDYHTGNDGRAIAIPPGGDYHTGNDGHAIAVPKGWDYHT